MFVPIILTYANRVYGNQCEMNHYDTSEIVKRNNNC